MIVQLEKFVKLYYAQKDQMHDLSHIQRVYRQVQKLSEKYNCDEDILLYGCYFHGIVSDETAFQEITSFLISLSFVEDKIKSILEAAKKSDKNAEPITIEEKILHDAHLLEGGESFWIVKMLVTGTVRGATFAETVQYLKKSLILNDKFIGQFKCYLPEAQDLYQKKEIFAVDFAKRFVSDWEL